MKFRQKITDDYYIIDNKYDVMRLARWGMKWKCHCPDWIYNQKNGKLGDCKHVKVIKLVTNES